MQPGQLLSGAPPSQPLFIQAAIKNSLDIFYFSVPFELSAVLMESGTATREQFTQVWQRVGEEGQHAVNGQLEAPLTTEALKSRLQLDNIHSVAQREADGSTYHYFS